MTIAVSSPLSRLVSVTDLPPRGLDVTVEASPEEREALARDFKLPAIHSLTGSFHVAETRSGVHVSGHVAAGINQICVVTLEPFDSEMREDVDVEFAAPAGKAEQAGEESPDEIVNGTVDLGALTAEFLALGLDPYPRKPGVDFTFEAADDGAESPFAALGKLKRNE
jgi:uncharacterized metal-binding protein YceD (DUF177 family)